MIWLTSINLFFMITMVSCDSSIYKKNWARLQYVPDDIPANTTTEIQLKHNRITLRPNDFTGFYILEELNLAGNHMEFLEPEAFRDLNSLRILVLSNNKLTAIPNLHHVADSLIELNMEDNSLVTIPDDSFLQFSVLESLNLNKCKISSFGSRSLNGLLALKTFSLSDNSIDLLDTHVFDSLSSLTSINLDKNGLNHLPNFNISTLESLSVEQNNLITTNSSFTGTTGLKRLNLDSNELANWPELGDAAHGIETLSINDNKIVNVLQSETELFHGLVTLTLNSNKLQELPYFPNSKHSLESLEANNNNVSIIDSHYLDDYTELTHLDISKNKLLSFPDSRLEALQSLNLEENLLQTFSRSTLQLMPKLKVIYLNKNNISEFPDFELCVNMEEIHISHNRINLDISRHLSGLTQLTQLYVGSNKLSTFPNFSYVSPENTSLQILDLSENYITSATYEHYRVLNNLQILELGGNNFEEAPAIFNVSYASLEMVNISYNIINR